MYKSRYIQYFNLPAVPDYIIESIKLDPNFYTKKISHGNYNWTDQYNEELNAWAQEYICADMYFAFQFFERPNNIHKDTSTHTKINYIISAGGDNVLTEFYADDMTTVLDTYCIEPLRWHVLKADTFHKVSGPFDSEKIRFSITAKLFDYNGGSQQYVNGISPN
jgi:predicted PolB exonuclease-like 3'-5' exonuclease